MCAWHVWVTYTVTLRVCGCGASMREFNVRACALGYRVCHERIGRNGVGFGWLWYIHYLSPMHRNSSYKRAICSTSSSPYILNSILFKHDIAHTAENVCARVIHSLRMSPNMSPNKWAYAWCEYMQAYAYVALCCSYINRVAECVKLLLSKMPFTQRAHLFYAQSFCHSGRTWATRKLNSLMLTYMYKHQVRCMHSKKCKTTSQPQFSFCTNTQTHKHLQINPQHDIVHIKICHLVRCHRCGWCLPIWRRVRHRQCPLYTWIEREIARGKPSREIETHSGMVDCRELHSW